MYTFYVILRGDRTIKRIDVREVVVLITNIQINGLIFNKNLTFVSVILTYNC